MYPSYSEVFLRTMSKLKFCTFHHSVELCSLLNRTRPTICIFDVVIQLVKNCTWPEKVSYSQIVISITTDEGTFAFTTNLEILWQRNHLDFSKKSRLIICAAPQRAGGAWLFNAIRLIFKASRVPYRHYQINHLSDAAIKDRYEYGVHMIVKTHEFPTLQVLFCASLSHMGDIFVITFLLRSMHFMVFTINCTCHRQSDSFSTDRLPMQATWEKIWNQLGLHCSRCRIHHTSWPSWCGCLVSQNEVGEKPPCVLCLRSYGMDETRNYRLLLWSHFARRIMLPPGIKNQVCLDIIVFLHVWLISPPFLLV